MQALIRRIFAILSIAGATALLCFGWYLIDKNTPRKQQASVRFTPPSYPGNDIQLVSDGITDERKSPPPNGNTSNKSIRTDGPSRYIGGIGIIEPAGEAISIGAQAPGIVAEVFVKPGDHVKKGDRLILVDDRSARANVKVAQANLSAQLAKLRELNGQIAPQRARVDSSVALLEQAKASSRNARQDLERAKLVEGTGVSIEELELRRMNVAISDAKVNEAEARYREAKASLDLLAGEDAAPTIMVQQAAIEQAKASLEKEETELQLRLILAPRDATVLQVKIRAGEFAPAVVLATPLMILGVTEPLHVRVDIDESEIPRFNPNAKAFASVRGRPDVRVLLQFVRAEPYVIPKRTLSGGVSERVDTRVLQLIYSVASKEIDAISGQQVDVYIEEVGK